MAVASALSTSPRSRHLLATAPPPPSKPPDPPLPLPDAAPSRPPPPAATYPSPLSLSRIVPSFFHFVCPLPEPPAVHCHRSRRRSEIHDVAARPLPCATSSSHPLLLCSLSSIIFPHGCHLHGKLELPIVSSKLPLPPPSLPEAATAARRSHHRSLSPMVAGPPPFFLNADHYRRSAAKLSFLLPNVVHGARMSLPSPSSPPFSIPKCPSSTAIPHHYLHLLEHHGHLLAVCQPETHPALQQLSPCGR